MPRKKNAITKKDGYATGKSTSQEQSVLMHLKSMVKTDTKVYYILWKYASELLPQQFKTFDDLKNNFKCFTAGVTEKNSRELADGRKCTDSG